MTIDEGIAKLAKGIYQLAIELDTGLWEAGSEAENFCKETYEQKKQLMKWLMELKELKAESNDCAVSIDEFITEIAKYKSLLKEAVKKVNEFGVGCFHSCEYCVYSDHTSEGIESCTEIHEDCRFKWELTDEIEKLIQE